MEETVVQPQIETFLARGEELGCLELTEVNQFVQSLELDDDATETLLEEIETRGIKLRDDCGRESADATYVNGDLASSTTDALQLFLNEAGRYSLLTAEQEVELAKRIERGDQEAKDLMVNSNLRLVVSIAKRYQGHDLSLLDLIQEGIIGLIRAVEKFDWRKAVRFSTYGAFWVRQAVERMITANRGMVRVPNYVQQKLRRLRREGKLPRNHRDVDLRDVSRQFDSSPEAAARLMETDRATLSLDAPVSDDETSLGSLLAAQTDEGGPLSGAEKHALNDRLQQVMAQELTDTEREIIASRFGLDGRQPETLDEIGERLAVSRERIRQMQVKALDKLHKPRLLDELRDWM
jgi:RNA polymerase primary sigma factor